MDPILLRTQLLFCHKYKIKLTLNSKNVKQLITTAIISIEMFLSRECGWLIYTQNKTTKNGYHPGSYFTHLFRLELYLSPFFSSLTNQPTFWDATTGFPTKWCLRNEHKMSILMTHHYPHQGSAFHWLKIYFIHSEAVPRSAGLSLRAEGWGFAAATFLGNKGKMRPKELPGSSVLHLQCTNICPASWNLSDSPADLGSMEFLHMCSDFISRGNQCWHCKMSAVYKSIVIYRTTMYLPLSSGTMLLCCISIMVVKPMSEIAFSVFSLTNPSSDLNSLLSGTVTSGQKINIKSFYKHQQ